MSYGLILICILDVHKQAGVSMFNYEVALNYWEVFLLIVVRIASFVYTAPFFNMANTPQRTKLGLTFFISVIIFTLIPERTVEYNSIIEYATMVVKESVVGLLLGFSCNICVHTITFAGHVMDTNIGLSMASMYDPTLKEQTSISGTLYYYTTFLMLMISGLHHFLISAIVDTYTIIPVNGMGVNMSLYTSMLTLVADYFIIGFRIALPIFVSVMVVNCVLGILTKVASQLNMFAVGIQIKIIVGFIVMYLTISLLPHVANFIYQNMRAAMKLIAGGLT